ncbi:MAG: aromatic ring-hydroxylating dioxygenase subunit alpha [Emcibacter sp.]|nr:aromatic ring-hydroxylating dioxygenase subunit alpha [Emcibacter sp.]
MSFVKNAWYVAGWAPSEDVRLFSRTILGKSIVFFRKTNDQWSAIENVCPHRFAPLDKGKVVGDTLQCGYHGLRFDEHGICVHNPIGNGRIPKAAKVDSYPVIEKYKLIWVWTGDKEAADPAKIPDYSILEDEGWVHATGGYLHCNANYQLLIDNLLDLSHVAFLHPLLGNEGMSGGKLDLQETDTTIQSNFFMAEIDSPPFYAPRYKEGSKVDNWLNMKWHAPSSLLLDFGVTDVGKSRDVGLQGIATHILTPETDGTVHYFYSVGWPTEEDAAANVEQHHEMQGKIFSTEDKPMLEECQKNMGTTDLWDLNPVLLSGDAAAVRARRFIGRMLAQEAIEP